MSWYLVIALGTVYFANQHLLWKTRGLVSNLNRLGVEFLYDHTCDF